ncbi:hypothetical protein Kfla_0009 [Kribbella flavida DSM 17836]|uniref:DUF4352 domain-containing protein n=1 Tax=Kribbella flavida (strain DSM 17836 / JCM 10339 / NBRC 14399) TaxID=479435 RepID=D2PQF3_KRIFD|nr:hypothetical protein [Kribbella flavida]ADB29140.1 hypothetical protein Kfla_0009 [Kribbella flavida DSM 17836]
MESLDDVIDAMIADRVIHRHRRKWLIALAVVVVLALVITVTGGWKEHQGRSIPTVEAPVTVEAGRFEFGFTSAKIIRRPKTEYGKAETWLQISFDLKNIDEETKTSYFVPGDLLRLVPGGGQEPIESNGASCQGELGYVTVYGLPAQPCTAKFDVPVDFAAEKVEIGVLGEQYTAPDEVTGASGKPYWHDETAVTVVRIPATIETEKEDS